MAAMAPCFCGESGSGALEPCLDEQQMQRAVEQLNALRRESAPCAAASAGMQRVATRQART